MPTRRAANAKTTSADVQTLRARLQSAGVTPGQVDDLLRGASNLTRQELVTRLTTWLRTRPRRTE